MSADLDPVEEYMTPLEYLTACRLAIADINSFNSISAGIGRFSPGGAGQQLLTFREDNPYKNCYWNIERVVKQFGLRVDRSQVPGEPHWLRFPKKHLSSHGAGPAWCEGSCGFALKDGRHDYEVFVPDYLVALELEEAREEGRREETDAYWNIPFFDEARRSRSRSRPGGVYR